MFYPCRPTEFAGGRWLTSDAVRSRQLLGLNLKHKNIVNFSFYFLNSIPPRNKKKDMIVIIYIYNIDTWFIVQMNTIDFGIGLV